MQLIALDYYSCTVTLSVIALLYLFKRSRRSSLPYPPGPKGLPVIGNLLDVPKSHEWKVYAEWGRKYKSDVLHLDVAGTHLVIVNTLEASTELFDKRSSIYSDRPHLNMLYDLVGMDWAFPIIPYGNRWKSHRRLFHSFFNQNVVHQWHPQELKAAHALLQRLLETPENFWDHVRLLTGSLILDFTYGIDAKSVDDPIIQLVEESMQIVSKATIPGVFLVDTLPFLKYVPEWMPGAGFKKLAREWNVVVQDTADKPLQYVKDEMAKGTNRTSIVSLTLEKEGTDEKVEEEVIRGVAATAYGAGSDTTVSALYLFILAMVLHPEVALKAQAELDRVVGRRLPDFSDRDSLPFISAIVQEVLRWSPVTPLGVPHLLMTDDVYNGMFMPAGSIVIGNSWAILQDEKVYPEPTRFNPDRFMKDGNLNPKAPFADAAFGFGRRVCPGLHLGLSTLFINVASILSVFDIAKAVDEQGNTIEISGEIDPGLICRPLPFKCSFKPRSKQASNLIAEAYSNLN